MPEPISDDLKHALAGIAKESLAAFVKSDDFTGTLHETITSATSETVNKAITSKLKSFENRLDSKIAEAVKEAVPEKDPDDEPAGDGTDAKDLTDEAILKSKPYKVLEKSHTKLQAELEKDRSERQSVEAGAFRKERDADLIRLATEGKAVNAQDVCDAIQSKVSRDEDGALVVVTNKGKDDETVQPTAEYVTAYLKARPHLVKASDGGGAGSGSGTGGGAGGGGGDEEITQAMLKDPATFKRLRAEGKIPGVPAEQTTS